MSSSGTTVVIEAEDDSAITCECGVVVTVPFRAEGQAKCPRCGLLLS